MDSSTNTIQFSNENWSFRQRLELLVLLCSSVASFPLIIGFAGREYLSRVLRIVRVNPGYIEPSYRDSFDIGLNVLIEYSTRHPLIMLLSCWSILWVLFYFFRCKHVVLALIAGVCGLQYAYFSMVVNMQVSEFVRAPISISAYKAGKEIEHGAFDGRLERYISGDGKLIAEGMTLLCANTCLVKTESGFVDVSPSEVRKREVIKRNKN